MIYLYIGLGVFGYLLLGYLGALFYAKVIVGDKHDVDLGEAITCTAIWPFFFFIIAITLFCVFVADVTATARLRVGNILAWIYKPVIGKQ